MRKISDFIAERYLLNKDDKYIVALSGGADSVYLLLALKRLGYNIEAAHCNFHLRGDESDRDERFCISLCEKNAISLHLAHFDTRSYAELHKVSIEMAARDLRYAYFNQLKTDIRANGICVGHHRDDSVETVLLNLMRGTGVRGLTGISPKNGDVVRPLLCLSRTDIEEALNDMGQPYVTDSTNFVDDVTRNKIRLGILPLMRQINPSVAESISKTAKRLRVVVDSLDTILTADASRVVTSCAGGAVVVDIAGLRDSAAPEELLFSIIRDYSFNSTQTEQVFRSLAGESGKIFISSSHQLLIDRTTIVIEPLEQSVPKPFVIPEEGVYVYDDRTKFRVQLFDYTPDMFIRTGADSFFADASAVRFPLIVRRVIPSDRFVPFGMKGSKLVSDYLTDRKVNLFEKRRQLVLTSADDTILWVIGHRSDSRCRVEGGEKVLKVEFLKE